MFFPSISIRRLSLRKRKSGAAKAKAIKKELITIHIFFIFSLLASTKIQTVIDPAPINKSLDKDCAAGFIFASYIKLLISKLGP